jgi:hypothetical protein
VEEVTERTVESVRQHLLRFHIPRRGRLREGGDRHDATCGFNLGLGFRGFIAHPYRPFSLASNRQLDLLELPLVIQDKAVFQCEWSHEERMRACRNVLAQLKRWGGAGAVLWHSDAVNAKRYPALFRVYEEIVDWVVSEGGFVGSMREVGEWWRRRQEKVEVVCRVRKRA